MHVVVFRPPVADSDRALYDVAFKFWLRMWQDTHVEIDKPAQIPSDSFTKQSEIITLFEGERPVAMICLRFADFKAEATYYDSFFMHPGLWREEDIALVRKIGGKGLFGTQIAVDPDYRKTDVKALIVLLALDRAQTLGAETIVSFIRAQKGLDRLFQGAGCLVIAKDRAYGSVFADLVAFQPQKDPIRIHEDYAGKIRSLWRNAYFTEPMSFTAERKAA